MAAGDDRGAGVGPLRIGERRASAAQRNMQRVVLEHRRVVGFGDLVDHDTPNEGALHRWHEPDDSGGGSSGRKRHANGDDQASHAVLLVPVRLHTPIEPLAGNDN
jgi:hypothetical protein